VLHRDLDRVRPGAVGDLLEGRVDVEGGAGDLDVQVAGREERRGRERERHPAAGDAQATAGELREVDGQVGHARAVDVCLEVGDGGGDAGHAHEVGGAAGRLQRVEALRTVRRPQQRKGERDVRDLETDGGGRVGRVRAVDPDEDVDA